jgi:hypothetical protein
MRYLFLRFVWERLWHYLEDLCLTVDFDLRTLKESLRLARTLRFGLSPSHFVTKMQDVLDFASLGTPGGLDTARRSLIYKQLISRDELREVEMSKLRVRELCCFTSCMATEQTSLPSTGKECGA